MMLPTKVSTSKALSPKVAFLLIYIIFEIDHKKEEVKLPPFAGGMCPLLSADHSITFEKFYSIEVKSPGKDAEETSPE